MTAPRSTLPPVDCDFCKRTHWDTDHIEWIGLRAFCADLNDGETMTCAYKVRIAMGISPPPSH